jgi:hypothetical protein
MNSTTAITVKYMNRHLYTDIQPFEVVSVAPSGKTASVRQMDAVVVKHPDLMGVGGFSAAWDNGTAKHEITSNQSNPSIKVRLHKDGWWRDSAGNRYSPSAEPIKYYDRNF